MNIYANRLAHAKFETVSLWPITQFNVIYHALLYIFFGNFFFSLASTLRFYWFYLKNTRGARLTAFLHISSGNLTPNFTATTNFYMNNFIYEKCLIWANAICFYSNWKTIDIIIYLLICSTIFGLCLPFAQRINSNLVQ